jgi:hypothetical protein
VFVSALSGFQQVVMETPERIMLFCVILGGGFAIVGAFRYRKDHNPKDNEETRTALMQGGPV